MTASVTCPEDVLNLALVRIGYPQRVTSMYEGSRAADAALLIYAQTRDELLRQGDWGFAEQNTPATLLKQAPAGGYIPPVTWSTEYPALPWLYSYVYPPDCLRVRAIKPIPLFPPNMSPSPQLFSVDLDSSLTPPARVILANCFPAVLVYVGQNTDPTLWDPDFVEAMAASLARRLAPMLASPDATKMEAQDEVAEDSVAQREIG